MAGLPSLPNLPSADAELILKIIMVGDSGFGKSCLLKAFMGEPFDKSYTSTIGVDFEIKPITITDAKVEKQVNLQIWDTAGQERFRTITTSYYRSSDAILLIFDVSEKQTFKNCEAWLEDVRLYAKDKVDIMLLGNKADLVSKRVIDYKTAKEFADKHNMMYMETSAKQNVNVDKAFTKLATAAYAQKVASDARNRAAKAKEAVNLNKQQAPDSGAASSSCAC